MGYDTEGGRANGSEKVGQGERGACRGGGGGGGEGDCLAGPDLKAQAPCPPLIVSLELGAGTWYDQTRDWIPSLRKDTSLSHLNTSELVRALSRTHELQVRALLAISNARNQDWGRST
jgi:hypothetical protein